MGTTQLFDTNHRQFVSKFVSTPVRRVRGEFELVTMSKDSTDTCVRKNPTLPFRHADLALYLHYGYVN